MTTPMPDLDKLARGLTERRPIPGYEGMYEIDTQGAVYSLSRTFQCVRKGASVTVSVPGRTLARTYSRKGYPQVSLHKDGKGRTRELHVLVCETFHGPRPERHQAAHLNGNKDDASAENIAWVTPEENCAHKKIHGTHLQGDAVKNAVLTAEKVREIVTAYQAGGGQSAIARTYGVNPSTVHLILAGKLWAHETAALKAHIERTTHD